MNAIILIVDRDNNTARSSKRLLETAGYEVVLAATDEDARQYMRNHHVDVVVVKGNVEHESQLELSKWHEDYVPGAFYHRSNADPQHLLHEIESEVGDLY